MWQNSTLAGRENRQQQIRSAPLVSFSNEKLPWIDHLHSTMRRGQSPCPGVGALLALALDVEREVRVSDARMMMRQGTGSRARRVTGGVDGRGYIAALASWLDDDPSSCVSLRQGGPSKTHLGERAESNKLPHSAGESNASTSSPVPLSAPSDTRVS